MTVAGEITICRHASSAFTTGSVDEILANHVLEHLGASVEVFIGVMKEMYRVCKPGAKIQVNVPHPRHDFFIGDPTHVRVITPDVLSLFSKRNCRAWAQQGAPNSPLALFHDVDFDIISAKWILDEEWQKKLDSGHLTHDEVDQAMMRYNNVVSEIRMVLEVIKS